jgi:hypothetical protein
MLPTYTIDSPDEAEAFPVIVKAPADPTGEPIEFGFVAEGTTGRPVAWTEGTWGTWSATSGTARAVSPTIGTAGDVTLASGVYVAWARPSTGTETSGLRFGRLVVGSS